MSSLDNNIDLFDLYTNDGLSKEEKITFESRLKEDSEFSADFERYRNGIIFLESHGVREELKQIIELEKTKRTWVYSSVAAASIIVILYFSIFINNNPSSQEVFYEYFEPYPNLVATRSANASPLVTGLSAYGSGDYKKAIEEFRNQSNSRNDTILFYFGLSYLAIDQPDSAISKFDLVFPHSTFKQQINWYTALALLNTGKVQEAISILKEIKSGDFKFREATTILKSFQQDH